MMYLLKNYKFYNGDSTLGTHYVSPPRPHVFIDVPMRYRRAPVRDVRYRRALRLCMQACSNLIVIAVILFSDMIMLAVVFSQQLHIYT